MKLLRAHPRSEPASVHHRRALRWGDRASGIITGMARFVAVFVSLFIGYSNAADSLQNLASDF